MWDAAQNQPQLVWNVILLILERGVMEEQVSLLAAGPLESLPAWHGAQFIERVECEAAASPRFNHLLGGGWQNDMTPEIWGRVQKARKESW